MFFTFAYIFMQNHQLKELKIETNLIGCTVMAHINTSLQRYLWNQKRYLCENFGNYSRGYNQSLEQIKLSLGT